MAEKSKPGNEIVGWMPPSPAALAAAFARLRANHPPTTTLTLSAKLRMTWAKQDLLVTAQQRITAMKAEILETFRHDLECINSGQADDRLVDAIVTLVYDQAGHVPAIPDAIHDLRGLLKSLRASSRAVPFVQAIITTTLAPVTEGQEGLAVLRQTLEQWHAAHLDRRLDNTLAKITQRAERAGASDSSSIVTPAEIQQIRMVILLRKALGHTHEAQVMTLRVAMLAERAERQCHDDQAVHQLELAISKRCAGQLNERFIAVLCAAVAEFDQQAGKAEQLKVELLDGYIKIRQKRSHARNIKYQGLGLDLSTPLIRFIIALLAAPDQESSSDAKAIAWLRECLERWYQTLPATQAQTVAAAFSNSNEASSLDPQRRLRYAVLLRSFLEATCRLSTDVLVLVELAEAVTRQLGDGTQLLYGLLSHCYSDTCSAFKYPLSGVLRSSVFQDCAGQLLGWCQQVIDYRVERTTKQFPLPKQNTARELYCKITPFFKKRVVFITTIYSIWAGEQAQYHSALAAKVPSGPDAGKALGNTDRLLSHHDKGRRGKALRRRTSVLGAGVLGKRGARRYKKWLLPLAVAQETLTAVETLLFPDLHIEDAIRHAKSVRDPWWRGKKLRRRVERIRPTQFQDKHEDDVVYLWQLSQAQLHDRRLLLREQVAFAAQFEQFGLHLDRFLEEAPPAYPHVEMPLFTDADVQNLPFEWQSQPPTSYETRKRNYDTALRWFQDFRSSRHSSGDEYSPEKLYDIETMAAQDLERAAAALQQYPAQSIKFHRTMDSSLQPKAFTLLFYRRSRGGSSNYRYLLVCELVGTHAPERDELVAREHGLAESHQHLVNAPDHQFVRPINSSFVFFPLEIGEDYQGRMLSDVIRQQQAAPKKCKTGCQSQETGMHLPGCAPEAIISTATIVRVENSAKSRDWYVHLPIAIPTRPCITSPNAVMGLHEHQGCYSYAVVNLESQLIDIGVIVAPEHVGPQTLKGQTSDNFAFEMAWGILRQSSSKAYSAYIGFENTGWKRRQVSISTSENRERFAFPRERIYEITRYKAAIEGQLEPIKISGVAPTRDCGHCGHRYEDDHGIRLRSVQHCFHCHSLGLSHTLRQVEAVNREKGYRCTRCARIWGVKEPQFKCMRCGWQQHAAYNTAIVVARRTFYRLVETGQHEEPNTNEESDLS